MNSEKELSGKTVLLMAIAAGVIVANLNYIQPIEGLIATSFQVSKATVGVVAMLTQLGYAFGLLLIVPLGDIFNRYHLIQVMLILSIVALLLAFWAPSVTIFGAASLLVGITSVAPQIIIPYAAYLAPDLHQGKVLGNVLSGLLTGILLSRSVSGLLGSIMNWQYVYLIAALACAILLVILHVYLPRDPRAHQNLSYIHVLGSLPKLLLKEKHLQGSAINGFCLFGVSNVLWSTLAFYLAAQYHMGSDVAGLLGLLGITGVLFASIIGRLVDRYSPRMTVGLGILFSALAFLIFASLGHFFIGLMIGIVLLDLGTQFGQVSNQAIVQSLNREASSRNNSIFMFSYFLGGALGTFFSTFAWSHFGWAGVCSVAAIFLVIALAGHLIMKEPKQLRQVQE
ncbi:MFS transporter [Loigolactobacillus backii]|uniref:MFS transporter permease n=1 Tax=Loigolactobacillus backii TaxID=375175 RepID=A0A192H1U5_9LACO|nr:MFS transporter [Loigolactobacillus backii]ANK60493.1 MFS transporter permease [Loigolactobacillus backii]ANK61916.1 MFS transporter permease [Loigolactobacillus backii]ANK65464.1 MFS transporter permease [Loigolactobacillus backii]ANK68890.1 MFS transporter permease [Loigolactobacillus backii]MDA5386887.1 MFS transporter [Loigolactobacillus backii]